MEQLQKYLAELQEKTKLLDECKRIRDSELEEKVCEIISEAIITVQKENKANAETDMKHPVPEQNAPNQNATKQPGPKQNGQVKRNNC